MPLFEIELVTDDGFHALGPTFSVATGQLDKFLEFHHGKNLGFDKSGDEHDEGTVIIDLPEEAVALLEEQNFIDRIPHPGIHPAIFPHTGEQRNVGNYQDYDFGYGGTD